MSTSARKNVVKWAGLFSRLAAWPEGYGPHDTGALCADIRSLVAERDRLARILAVESGDETQAPEWWKYTVGTGFEDYDATEAWWYLGEARVLRGEPGDEPTRGAPWRLWTKARFGWKNRPTDHFPTALAAMEAFASMSATLPRSPQTTADPSDEA